MTIQLETSHQMEPTDASNHDPEDELIIRLQAACPGCQSQVILFSRTIQTFCYRCGLPVTRPDPAGLYYEVVNSEEPTT